MSKSFWKSNSLPLAIAHRGGGARHRRNRYLKENTLETFAATVNQGYEFLELDVTATKDNQVIVLHVSLDPIEKRVRKDAPDAIKMQAYTQLELKQMLGRAIPKLEEVLKSFPKTKFFIDPKTDKAAQLLPPILKATKSSGRVFLNSYYAERVEKLMKLIGKTPEYGLIISRYPRLFNKNYKILMRGGYKGKGWSGIVLPYRYLSEKTIKNLHQQGFKVLAWTPNNNHQINRCLKLKVDGIMTDNAELLAKRLLRTATSIR